MTGIDPTANTAAYRLFTALPDNRIGFGILHALSQLSRWSRPKGLKIDRITIPGSGVNALILRPAHSTGRLPMVLHLHGGGYAVGSPWQDLDLMRRYIAHRPAIFVAPFYRLSRTAPYPAALDDAHAALVWMKQNADTLGGHSDRIFVMGESAGGGLTAALSLLARDRKSVAIAAQFPIYAMLDTPSERDAPCDPKALSWSVGKNVMAWDWYLKGNANPPVYAVPARATDLTGLPPTYGFVGDHDLFLDQNVRFFDRLTRTGVTADLRIFQGAYHGTEILAPASETGRAILSHALDLYAKALEHHCAPQVS